MEAVVACGFASFNSGASPTRDAMNWLTIDVPPAVGRVSFLVLCTYMYVCVSYVL